MNKSKCNYVIVGDFNIDTEKYNIASYATNYLNCLRSYGCYTFIDKPTRVEGNSASSLDHVYSNMNANRIENHILLSDVSDHFATLTKIKGIEISHKHEKIYRRNTNLSEQEQNKFNDDLEKDLSEKISFGNDSDPNKTADELVKIFHSLIDKYMPLKKLTRKQVRFYHRPWITPGLKVSIAKKNKLFDIAKKTKDPQKFEEYKKFRNLLTRTKLIAEDSYYREKMIEYGQDKAKTWRLINEISKRKRKNTTSITCLKGKNGKTLHDKREISNCLNSHFSSIGKNMAKEIDDLNTPGGVLCALRYRNSLPKFVSVTKIR